jgi:MoaA/NifB/PqqE/SkfB family radical SAM enzyme
VRTVVKKDAAGAHSMRRHMNHSFANHFDEMMANTNEDGSLNKHKMAYFDVRFSNICNFKCRGCSPALSSSWLDDHQKLFDYESDRSKYIQIFPNEKFEKDLIELLPTVEEAYFAGGEPLIMKEHYLILDELIKLGKTDIRLVYTTNMSILKFKGKSIVDYWSQFKNLFVGVSIDDFGKRGEYFRKGMNWEETVENIKIIKEQCPHAYFTANCTVNIMNVLNIFDLHRKLVDLDIIQPHDIVINLMLDPDEYSIQVLPEEIKRLVEKKFQKHMIYCSQKFPEQYDYIRSRFTSIINYMNSKDNSDLFEQFINRTEKTRFYSW